MTVRNPIVLIPGGNPQFQELPAGDVLGGAAQGPVGMTWQGTWSSGTSYAIDDAVEYNGSAYIAIQAGTNHTPDPAGTAYWDLLASKGDTGAAGTNGTDGAAGPNNGLVEQHTASSGDATMDFTTGISSTYDEYELRIIGFQPATGSADLLVRVMTGSPATADTGSNYRWHNNRTSDGAANTATGSTSATSLNVTGSGGNIPTTSTKTLNGRIELWTPQSSSVHKRFRWMHSYDGASSVTISNTGGGIYLANTVLTGIRLLFSSGNIAAGTARLYGISKT